MLTEEETQLKCNLARWRQFDLLDKPVDSIQRAEDIIESDKKVRIKDARIHFVPALYLAEGDVYAAKKYIESLLSEGTEDNSLYNSDLFISTALLVYLKINTPISNTSPGTVFLRRIQQLSPRMTSIILRDELPEEYILKYTLKDDVESCISISSFPKWVIRTWNQKDKEKLSTFLYSKDNKEFVSKYNSLNIEVDLHSEGYARNSAIHEFEVYQKAMFNLKFN